MSTRAERRKRTAKEALALQVANTPEQKRITCYHESAHGVLAEMYSIPVEYISVVPEIAPKDHPEALRARFLGALAIRMGGCQLQRENGIFMLKTPEHVFFNSIGLLASVAAEEKLGVPLEQAANSCNGDRILLMSYLGEHLHRPIDIEQANKLLYNIAAISTSVVNNEKVWAAIARVAALLMEKGRMNGSEVREIVREVVPGNCFFRLSDRRLYFLTSFGKCFRKNPLSLNRMSRHE